MSLLYETLLNLYYTVCNVKGTQRFNDEDLSVKLLLNDPENQGVKNRKHVNFDNISIINPNRRTIFVCHGFLETANVYYYKVIPQEYLKKGDFNVITVDWGSLARSPYICHAFINTPRVGRYLGEFVVKLKESGMDLKNIHIVGYSLGAHVAGYAGKLVYKELGKKINRITGLEPASALYSFDDRRRRLTKDDAEMVDILHTDGLFFSFYAPIGTVDFYANGGLIQPGCPNTKRVFCSHSKSIRYFIESINSLNFVSYRNKDLSGDTTLFGDNMPLDVTGVYYFNTNLKPPFAKGDIHTNT